jgi:putative aldouronate transport system substrate-binding protein
MKKLLCIILCTSIMLSISGCKAKQVEKADTTVKQVVEKPLEFKVVLDALAWTKNNKDINDSEEKKAWDKLTNSNIQYITPPHSDYYNKLNIMTASGDLPDVIIGANLANVVEADAVIPIDDYMKKFGQPLMGKLTDGDIAKFKVNGKTYAIPVLASISNQYGFLFRQDWLDNLGLKAPETLDEYYNVLKAFVDNDPDKNGKKDTYGGTFRSEFSWMSGFVGSFDIDSHNEITYDVVNGKLVPQQTQEKYREYLAYMKKLWSAKIFTPNSFVNTSDQWKKEIFTGIAGMWWHQSTRIDEYFMTQFDLTLGKNSGVKLIATKPPVGKDGKRGSPSGSRVATGIFINKKAQNPEKIFQYYVRVFTDEAIKDFTKYGIEGKGYKMVDGKKQWIPEALTNDSLLQIKEMVYNQSTYPIDDEEITARYGKRAVEIFKQNEQYNRKPYEVFEGKPLLPAEKDYPDQNKILLEYTVKIITGELPLDKFDEMVKRLKDAGLDKVTADRQAWYTKKQGN